VPNLEFQERGMTACVGVRGGNLLSAALELEMNPADRLPALVEDYHVDS